MITSHFDYATKFTCVATQYLLHNVCQNKAGEAFCRSGRGQPCNNALFFEFVGFEELDDEAGRFGWECVGTGVD